MTWNISVVIHVCDASAGVSGGLGHTTTPQVWTTSPTFLPRQLHWFSSEHADSKFLALIGRATVHALKDIVAGEELLTRYNERAHEPRAQRQSSLLQQWGFHCNFQACAPSLSFGKASNKRRKRLLKISDFLKSQKSLTSIRIGARNGKDLAAANEYLDLLEKEEILSIELAVM